MDRLAACKAMLFSEKDPVVARDSSGITLDSGIPGIDTLDHAWLEAGFLVWPRSVYVTAIDGTAMTLSQNQ